MSELVTNDLRTIAEPRRGLTYTESALCESPDDGVLYVNMKSFLKDGGFNKNGIKYYSGFFAEADLVSKDDLLIANTDVTREGDIIGVPALVPWDPELNKTVFSHHVTRLRLRNYLCVNYFFYLFCTDFYRRQMKKYARGTTVLMLDAAGLKRIPVTYHFQSQKQHKIARVLQTIDRSIEKTEALIDKHQKIKAGLMHDLFTRGIGPDGQLRPPREQAPELYQETPIGWIPKEWDIEAFGERINVIDPNPSHRYPAPVEDGCPICSTENFYGTDGFQLEKAKRVPETTYRDQNARCQFSPYDVVFARKGRIGLARRYGHDRKVFSHTVVMMKPYAVDVDKKWLLWLARSNWLLEGIEQTMNTNLGVPTLGVEFIKGIFVPFPKFVEQTATNASLEAVTQKVQGLEMDLEKLQKQKAGLMHDLLTGKVPVQVEPEAEPEAAHV